MLWRLSVRCRRRHFGSVSRDGFFLPAQGGTEAAALCRLRVDPGRNRPVCPVLPLRNISSDMVVLAQCMGTILSSFSSFRKSALHGSSLKKNKTHQSQHMSIPVLIPSVRIESWSDSSMEHDKFAGEAIHFTVFTATGICMLWKPVHEPMLCILQVEETTHFTDKKTLTEKMSRQGAIDL